MKRSTEATGRCRPPARVLCLCLFGVSSCGGRIADPGPSPLCDARPSAAPRHVTVGLTDICVWGPSEDLSCWSPPPYAPVLLDGLPSRAEIFRVGSNRICALAANGTATCGGGDEPLATAQDVATLDVWSAACSAYFSGQADCWWGRAEAAVGEGGPWPWRTIGGAGQFVCGLRADCTAECAGTWFESIEGYPTPPPELPDMLPPLEPLQALSVGRYRSCGLRADGSIDCWGAEYSDRREHPPPPGSFTQVAVGTWFACALREDGEALCWGAGGYWDTPVAFDPAPTPPPGPFLELDVGEEVACGVRESGGIECWGTATAGLLVDVPVELR